MEKQLEILIIEDTEENREAAKKACPEHLKLGFAEDYAEAVKEIESGKYAGLIIDLNFPRTKGQSPEQLGFELVKKYYPCLPYIVFTAGIKHHGTENARILLEEDEVKNLCCRITPGKNTPEGWKEAFKFLQEIGNLEMNYAALSIYLKAFGEWPRW